MHIFFIIIYQIFLLGLLTDPVLAFSRVGPPHQDFPLLELSKDNKGGRNPIKLAGGKGEHLNLFFKIDETPDQLIDISLVGNHDNHLQASFYLVPGLLNIGGEQDIFELLVPLDQAASLRQDEVFRHNFTLIFIVLKISPHHAVGFKNISLRFQTKKNTFEQPLQLQVWNFSLPDDLPITILGNFWPRRDWFARYGIQSEKEFVQVIKAYLRLMRDYKINALGNFYPVPVQELIQGKSLHDFPSYIELLDNSLSLGYRFFRFPSLPGAEKIGTADNFFSQHAPAFYANLEKFARHRQVLGKAIVKVWDEPKENDYPRVAQAYGIIKKAAPGLLTETAGRAPEPMFKNLIDIWVMFNGYFDKVKLAQAVTQGQKVWLYANSLHPYFRPAISQRLIGWYVYYSGCSGYLLWSVNYWFADPWTNPPKRGREDYYRGGTFFYPHPITGMPLPTLRLEALRRGWEDYQYFSLLKQKMQEGKISRDDFAKIEKQAQDLVGDIKNHKPNASWQQVEYIRFKMGELLNLNSN